MKMRLVVAGLAAVAWTAAARGQFELPMPAPAAHLTARGVLSVDAMRPGDAATAAVVLDIAENMHIQSDRPLQEGLIATTLSFEPAAGLRVGPPSFPEPKFRELPGLGRVSEFAGRTIIAVALQAAPDAAPGPRTLRGTLRYQACNEAGTCFPPETLTVDIPVEVVEPGTPVQATHADLFAAAPPTTMRADAAGSPAPPTTVPAGNGERGIVYYLLFALLGGLILNITPCVLPLISIKVLSFVQQAGERPGRVALLGWLFAAGIVASFLLLAGGVAVLQLLGRQAGWGFLFQSGAFNVALAVVLFAFALSLLGVYEINLPGAAAERLDSASHREGPVGSFLKGAFATVLATPCVGPFVGSALAWSLAQPLAAVFALYAAMGIGMALPYMILSVRPGWIRWLPKPGDWMTRFKQVMGFLLLAFVISFLPTIGELLGDAAVPLTLVFLLAVSMGAWLIGLNTPATARRRKHVRRAIAGVIVLATGWVCYGVDWSEQIEWQPYQVGLERQLSREGKTVLVDFTAAWCKNCTINKTFVLETDKVRRKLRELDVVTLRADFTRQPPDLFEQIKSYGRSGVPLNVIVPAGRPDEPIVLPELLTTGVVLDALERAGPSRP